MPWEVRARGDEWCVFKEGEEKPVGCHASRARALSQQRALYAQEGAMAAAIATPQPTSLEILPPRVELLMPRDERMDFIPALVAAVELISNRLVESEKTLAAVAEQMAKTAEAYERDRTEMVQALTAAVQARPETPVVNVTVPEQAPVVNVSVPEQPAPVVNVELPAERERTREVTFERDYDGRLEKALIEDSWRTT